MNLETPENIRTLQRKLYRKAKDESDYRFYLLYSSRQTWNPVLMVIDRSAAPKMRFGKYMNFSVLATPRWWTPICPNTSTPFHTGS
jgi:hypothetical protein